MTENTHAIIAQQEMSLADVLSIPQRELLWSLSLALSFGRQVLHRSPNNYPKGVAARGLHSATHVNESGGPGAIDTR